MRLPEKRKRIMARSMALGHCVCNPKKPCPCDVLIEQDLCPCAGERPDPPVEEVRLTKRVRKAGCASKIGRKDLEHVLAGLPEFPDPKVLVGAAAGDDAGVYALDGEFNLVQTVDVFSPVVDDPHTFGQICAANSVSDVYAMGGRPICALSIIGFPIEELPREVMTEILRGGVEKMREAGVAVIGGHSINDEEIKGGFAVTGLVKGTGAVTNAGAKPGDVLVLTKPIGTGLISFADQIGRTSKEAVEMIAESMATLNKDAAELMLEFGAHGATDVTGFSLLGHLSQMAKASNVTARIDAADVPIFAEALALAREDVIPGAAERNRESFAETVALAEAEDDRLLDLLFDAQTSGGLLVSLPKKSAEAYVAAMKSRGHEHVSIIGEVLPKNEKPVELKLAEPKNLVGDQGLEIGVREKPGPIIHDRLSCCEESEYPISNTEYPLSNDEAPMTRHSEDAPCCEGPPAAPQSPTSDSRSPIPEAADAFKAMMAASGKPGLVDGRTKRLASLALAIAQKCEPCFVSHYRNARKEGISKEEIEEIAWVATAFTGCTGRMFYLEIKKKMEAGSGRQ